MIIYFLKYFILKKKGGDLLSYLSESLRRFRNLCGLSQSELGKAAGVSDSRVSSFESGQAEPDAEQVARFAKALNEPSLLLAKCRECGIRNEGFKMFFPDADLKTFIEISEAFKELGRKKEEIDKQIEIVNNMIVNSQEFIAQFCKLQKMIKMFTLTTQATNQMAEMAVFIKR